MAGSGYDIDDQLQPSTSFRFLNSSLEDFDMLKDRNGSESVSISPISGRCSSMTKELSVHIRREKDKMRARERRIRESEMSRQDRREKCRIAQAKRRKEETEEQRQHRLAIDRERAKKRRQKETDEQKQLRLEMNRVRTAIKRQGTVENVVEALKSYQDDPEVKDLLTISGNKITQIGGGDGELKITIAVMNETKPGVYFKAMSFTKETDEQRVSRLEKSRKYTAKRRQEETPEQKRKRQERERNNTRKRRAQNSSNSSASRSTSAMAESIASEEPQSSFLNNSGRNSVGDDGDDGVVDILEIDEPQKEAEMNEQIREEEEEVDVQDEQPEPASSSLICEGDNANSIQALDLDFGRPHPSMSVDHLTNFNGCGILGTAPNPLNVQSFNNDISNLFDLSQIYQVFQPTVSLSDSPWPSASAENVLKDRNDMYLMQNFGLDTSASPHASTANFLGSLNQQHNNMQAPPNLFRDEPNPSAINMLLRNLSNNPQIDGSPFNSSFNANTFLGAGLGIACASPGAGVPSAFGNFDGRIDSILSMGNFSVPNNNQALNSPLNMSQSDGIDAIERPHVSTIDDLNPFFLQMERALEERRFDPPKEQEEAEDQRPVMARSMGHFTMILKNSFDSFILLLEATADQLAKEGCMLGISAVAHSCPDMASFPNSGLHLVVAVWGERTDFTRLRDLYYSSIYRQLQIKDKMEDEQLMGDDQTDKSGWSELYDTIRLLHLELAHVLFERRKTETVDTACFNSVERAELSMKRTHMKRQQSNQIGERRMTFLDFALIELFDFLDQIAQITWMVFPFLSRERNEIRANSEYRNMRIEF